MRFFFVDTENINEYSFIEKFMLTSNDTIIMFVSKSSKNIKIEDLKRFTESKAKIIYEDVYVGQNNALDFQLVAKLALMIGSNKNNEVEYFIVSNDKDFILPLKYLEDQTSIKMQILKTNYNEIAMDLDTDKEINLDKKTLDIFNKAKTLSELHNNLRELHGNDKGRNLYLQLKKNFNKQ